LEDSVLQWFRTALDSIFGGRLERAVLFGSRARGNARPDSDYDIAVFFRDPVLVDEEADRMAEFGIDILLTTGAVINPVRLPAGRWGERTAFMGELRRDGIELLAPSSSYGV
jgi:predicted nucleotidyltransferase